VFSKCSAWPQFWHWKSFIAFFVSGGAPARVHGFVYGVANRVTSVARQSFQRLRAIGRFQSLAKSSLAKSSIAKSSIAKSRYFGIWVWRRPFGPGETANTLAALEDFRGEQSSGRL
jgi:hypothetical protein